MNQHRAFGNRLIDSLQNGIEQSDGNRMLIPNGELEKRMSTARRFTDFSHSVITV
jgi:hypothetical protein